MKAIHWTNDDNIKWRHMTWRDINPDIERINKVNFLNKLDELHMAVNVLHVIVRIYLRVSHI